MRQKFKNKIIKYKKNLKIDQKLIFEIFVI